MLTKARGLAAGQLAKAAGVNLETIRYCETIGLMPAPPRTPGGVQRHSELTLLRHEELTPMPIALQAVAG